MHTSAMAEPARGLRSLGAACWDGAGAGAGGGGWGWGSGCGGLLLNIPIGGHVMRPATRKCPLRPSHARLQRGGLARWCLRHSQEGLGPRDLQTQDRFSPSDQFMSDLHRTLPHVP